MVRDTCAVRGLTLIRGKRLRGLLALGLTLFLPAALLAHLALQGSSPSAGQSLSLAPREVRLSFTEAIELPLSIVRLTGPGGEVALGPLEGNEQRTELTVRIVGALLSGSHTVSWQAVGRDGHPVRGEIPFFIEEEAVSPLEATPPTIANPLPAEATPTFDSQAPLYAAARWLGYTGLIGSIGGAGFAMLLLRLRRRSDGSPEFFPAALRATASFGLFAALLLMISLALRLQAQSHAVFGHGITAESVQLLTGSAWGVSFIIQAAAALLLPAGLALVAGGYTAGLALSGVAAVGLAISPAMSGHAASVSTFPVLAAAADGAHVLAAGLWLGTLSAFVLAGLPALRRYAGHGDAPLFPILLKAFSSAALFCGGLVVATGVLGATLQLPDLSDIWTTPYGRVLLGKLIFVLAVLAVGAFNWRRLPSHPGSIHGLSLFRRTATLELILTLVVIAFTAVLVAIPPPAHALAADADPSQPLPPE